MKPKSRKCGQISSICVLKMMENETTPSSTSIGGKKQGFGVPQNLGELDPQNDRFLRFWTLIYN